MKNFIRFTCSASVFLFFVFFAQTEEKKAKPKQLQAPHLQIEKDFTEKLTQVTVECWLRPLELKLRQGIISQGSGRSFALILKDGVIHFKTAGQTLSIEKKNIIKGHWVHITATWDGSHKKIWINGKKLAESKFSGSFTSTEKLRVGALNRKGEAGLSLDGELAQCIIYNRALNEEEVKKRSKSWGMKLPAAQDVVVYWPLDEGEGRVISDKSSRGYAGTLIGMESWVDATRNDTNSAGRKALRFTRERLSNKK